MSTAGQKGLMSVVYGAIVVAIMLVFIIQFRPNASQRTGSLSQQCVVMVRERCVDPKEFWASLSLAMPRGLDEQHAKKMNLRRQVMEGLIERTLLLQDAQRLKLAISEDDINKELVKGRVRMSLPVQYADVLAMNLNMPEPGVRLMNFEGPTSKAFDYKVYQRTIKSTTNRSEKEFKEMQREELVAERMRDLVRSRARLSEEEAFATFLREKSTAQIDFVRFRRGWVSARYLDNSPKVAEAWIKEHASEVDKSFTARKSEFPAGCRKTQHILIRLRTDTAPDGHEAAEAKSLAAKALDRVRAGEDFAAVAEDLSEDERSAVRGGELPCFTKSGQMVKPFEEGVFGLKAPGDVSELIETQYGFHVVKLVAIVSEDATQAEADGRKLVGADLMKSFEADQIMTDAGKAVLKGVQEGKTLAQATEDAIKALDVRFAAVLKKAADKQKAAAKGEETKPEDKPDRNRPKVESSSSFTPDGRPISDAARDANVAAVAFKIEKPGQVANDLVKLEDGYAVILLKEKKAATREQFEKEREEFVAPLIRAKGQEMLQAYINKLKQQAKAETRITESFAKTPDKDKGGEEGGGEE